MKKRLGLLAFILVLIFSLTACGSSSKTSSKSSNGGSSSNTSSSSDSSSSGSSSSSSSSKSSSSSSKSGGTTSVALSTATTTGVYYPLGAALAKMWNDKLPGYKVSSQSSDGSVQNINLMSQGKIDMAFTTIGVLYDAYNGKGEFKGRPYKDVRVVAALYPNVGQVVARKGAKINTVADFKGKKFVPGAPGSSTKVSALEILNAYGLGVKDVKPNYVGFTEATNLMRNNQADGAVIMAGIPTSAVIEMLTSAHGKLLSLGDSQIAALHQKYPWWFKYTIPAGTYDNQPKDVTTIAQANMLIVPKSMPDKEVYALTKAFWENIGPIGNSIAAAKNIKLQNAATGLAGVPLHPGALKYYKEKGIVNK